VGVEDLGDAAAAVAGILRIRVVALPGGDLGEEVAAAVIAVAVAADGDDDSNLQEGHAVL